MKLKIFFILWVNYFCIFFILKSVETEKNYSTTREKNKKNMAKSKESEYDKKITELVGRSNGQQFKKEKTLNGKKRLEQAKINSKEKNQKYFDYLNEINRMEEADQVYREVEKIRALRNNTWKEHIDKEVLIEQADKNYKEIEKIRALRDATWKEHIKEENSKQKADEAYIKDKKKIDKEIEIEKIKAKKLIAQEKTIAGISDGWIKKEELENKLLEDQIEKNISETEKQKAKESKENLLRGKKIINKLSGATFNAANHVFLTALLLEVGAKNDPLEHITDEIIQTGKSIKKTLLGRREEEIGEERFFYRENNFDDRVNDTVLNKYKSSLLPDLIKHEVNSFSDLIKRTPKNLVTVFNKLTIQNLKIALGKIGLTAHENSRFGNNYNLENFTQMKENEKISSEDKLTEIKKNTSCISFSYLKNSKITKWVLGVTIILGLTANFRQKYYDKKNKKNKKDLQY